MKELDLKYFNESLEKSFIFMRDLALNSSKIEEEQSDFFQLMKIHLILLMISVENNHNFSDMRKDLSRFIIDLIKCYKIQEEVYSSRPKTND